MSTEETTDQITVVNEAPAAEAAPAPSAPEAAASAPEPPAGKPAAEKPPAGKAPKADKGARPETAPRRR